MIRLRPRWREGNAVFCCSQSGRPGTAQLIRRIGARGAHLQPAEDLLYPLANSLADLRAGLGRGSREAELLEGEADLTVTLLAAYDLDRNVAG